MLFYVIKFLAITWRDSTCFTLRLSSIAGQPAASRVREVGDVDLIGWSSGRLCVTRWDPVDAAGGESLWDFEH